MNKNLLRLKIHQKNKKTSKSVSDKTRSEKPLSEDIIKYLNREINLKNKTLDELKANKDKIKTGKKRKYNKELKDLETEINSLISKREDIKKKDKDITI